MLFDDIRILAFSLEVPSQYQIINSEEVSDEQGFEFTIWRISENFKVALRNPFRGLSS